MASLPRTTRSWTLIQAARSKWANSPLNG
jgi:hypothetical protein